MNPWVVLVEDRSIKPGPRGGWLCSSSKGAPALPQNGSMAEEFAARFRRGERPALKEYRAIRQAAILFIMLVTPPFAQGGKAASTWARLRLGAAPEELNLNSCTV